LREVVQGRLRIDGAVVELKVQLWNVKQRTTEVEDSPLLRFVARKLLVNTWQRNTHCGELLLSKD
jgi:hypothetical protein